MTEWYSLDPFVGTKENSHSKINCKWLILKWDVLDSNQ